MTTDSTTLSEVAAIRVKRGKASESLHNDALAVVEAALRGMPGVTVEGSIRNGFWLSTADGLALIEVG